MVRCTKLIHRTRIVEFVARNPRCTLDEIFAHATNLDLRETARQVLKLVKDGRLFRIEGKPKRYVVASQAAEPEPLLVDREEVQGDSELDRDPGSGYEGDVEHQAPPTSVLGIQMVAEGYGAKTKARIAELEGALRRILEAYPDVNLSHKEARLLMAKTAEDALHTGHSGGDERER